MKISEMLDKIDAYTTKAIQYYKAGDIDLCCFYRNAAIGIRIKLENMEVTK